PESEVSITVGEGITRFPLDTLTGKRYRTYTSSKHSYHNSLLKVIRRMPRFLATKPLSTLTKEACEVGEHTLRRSLGPVNLITLGIGAIIGAGIFVLTGQAAALHAGPAVALSFIFAGITCAFAGLCYSEFASIIPIAGSAYTYG